MMDHQQFSPKSSPLGERGPSIAQNVDPSSLKMTISLKHKSPFYLLRPEPAQSNETTGATNLMATRGLEHSYNKLTTKKMKESLSSFLPNMPGLIDTPGAQDNSSLRGIIEKPPVCGKELNNLNQLQLAGFRLHPGPLPEQYRGLAQVNAKRKHKHKKHKHRPEPVPGAPEGGETKGEEEREKKREKKHKKHDKDAEDRKKKKKDKKKKRSKEEKE